MFYWIYDLPASVAAILFAIAFVAFNTLGIFYLRPHIRPLVSDLRDENNLIGNVLSLYSVMFGLLLGTLAVVTFQNLADAQKTADNEATAIAALYRDISAYPEPHGPKLTEMLRQHTRYIIEEGWPQQQRGLVPKGGVKQLDEFQAVLYGFEPRTKGQEALHAETIRQYNQFVIVRRARLNAVEASIPAILWQTIAAGSIVCLMLMWLFDASRRALVTLTGVAAFALGSMIGLIALMDHPFRGEVSVSSDPYKLIYENLMSSGR